MFAYLVNSNGADDRMSESGDRSVASFSAGGGERGREAAPQVRLLHRRVGPGRCDPAPSGRLLRGRVQRSGATSEGIVEAAKEDYKELVRLHSASLNLHES